MQVNIQNANSEQSKPYAHCTINTKTSKDLITPGWGIHVTFQISGTDKFT